MIDIKSVYPAGISGDIFSSFDGLIRSILMKSCFNINIKRTLNIAGFYSSYSSPECWTVKLLDISGVYGLAVSDARQTVGHECELVLKYFPDGDEDVLDTFSIAEISVATDPAYTELIRNFSTVPALHGLFDIGIITLSFADDGSSMTMQLATETQSKTVIREGLYLKTPSGSKELVPPMGTDRDVPSLELAEPFFRSFAGALNYCFDRPAKSLTRSYDQSFSRLLSADGTEEMPLAPDGDVRITLTYDSAEAVAEDEYKTAFTPAWWQSENKPDKLSVMDSRPRMLIISGFLGSGKTTYIRKLIEYETDKNRFAGIIQNEAGETGLDGFLVDYDCSLVQIDEGCVCCSLSGQIKAAVADLSKERRPDTIILETSGVANPMNLADELADLKEMVRFDSLTTIVDSADALSMLADSHLMQDQIRAADIIVLNKADLTDEKTVTSLYSEIRKLNRDALCIKAVKGETNFSLLYGVERDADYASKLAGASRSTHTHEHIATSKVSFDSPMTEKELTDYIRANAPHAFRVKGIVDIKGSGAAIVQCVNGRIELFRPDREPPSDRFLVVIARKNH